MRCQSRSLIVTFILSALATASFGARFPMTHLLALPAAMRRRAGQAGRRWCPAAGREPGAAPLGMLSRCSRTSERDHLARVRLDLGAVRGPGAHQLAPLLEQVAASVCGLDDTRYRVCKRHLGDF